MQVSSTNLSQIAYSEATQTSRSPQKNSSEEASETAAQKVIESAGQGDTVKVSISAQARLLKRQGYSIAQIASQLGMDAKTVNTYLNMQASGTPKTFMPSPGKSE
jgi:DNA-binding NarL/FixJ family response regulator